MYNKPRWEPEDPDWIYKETSSVDTERITQVVSNYFNSPACDESNLPENDELVNLIVAELAISYDKWKGWDGKNINKSLKPIRTIYDMVRY